MKWKYVKLITTWSWLYRQSNINFLGPKSKGISREIYVEILICSKCWKNSTSTTASSPMSSIFQLNLVFFQPPNFLLPRNNFQLSKLSTDLFKSNNRLSVSFRPLESSVKDKKFQSTFFYTKLYLKCHSSTTTHIAKLVLFYEKPPWREFLIQPKTYSTFWSNNRSELDTHFPIKDFVSTRQDLNFFDIILPLFCRSGGLE